MRANQQIAVRPLTKNDAGAFYAAVRESIDSLAYWMPWCTPEYSSADAENWVAYCEEAWRSQTEFPLGIFDVHTGKVIGGTGINHVTRAYRIGNIGYWVGTPHNGRGVAKAAALMAADIGFKELELTRLEIIVLLHNAASHRVASAIGAKMECNARNRLYFNGAAEDATVYSLVPKDIQALPDLQQIRRKVVANQSYMDSPSTARS